jgi:hypothetical protein
MIRQQGKQNAKEPTSKMPYQLLFSVKVLGLAYAANAFTRRKEDNAML